MQQRGALAYQQVARRTVSPRDLEADLLSKAAAQLDRVREDWDGRRGELMTAIIYNRKIWQVFLSSVTRPENPLPTQIKQNIANLGIFVMNQSRDAQVAPKPEKLNSLILINREIAAGLRTKPNLE